MIAEKFGSVLAAVGNSESKALALTTMSLETPYAAMQLRRRLVDLQGSPPAWDIDVTVVKNYCRRTFEGIGLIAKEVEGSEIRYRRTSLGEEVGVPLAGQALDISDRYSIPLQHLFGSTQSPVNGADIQTGEGVIHYKPRVPLTKLRMLDVISYFNRPFTLN